MGLLGKGKRDTNSIGDISEVGITIASLRLLPSKNNQDKYMLWAKDYEL
jgi:hypothetical protein